MSETLDNISSSTCGTLAQALVELRENLADGCFLRNNLYTVDDSRLAGNTHHYWVRFGLTPNIDLILDELLPESIPDAIAGWVKSRLGKVVFRRLPREYSTLIKIPFSVGLAEVADERALRLSQVIAQRLPTTIPYVIIHLEINRLLRRIGADRREPTDAETEILLARYSRSMIAKARRRYPETWDELRGHYVLDSRGAEHARDLVLELENRNLLHPSSQFVDIGSGIGSILFAVDRYSNADATGIERHPGLAQMSRVLIRRLIRMGILKNSRIDLRIGDGFDTEIIDLSKFDVVYVYSPIGLWEIDIDDVVDRANVGATIIFNRLPHRLRPFVETVDRVGGLFAFRKIASSGHGPEQA